jgi:GNAT superfamily N-acetyltransferase
VQVEGVIEEVVDPADKARALQAFMRKFQPEGGHREIAADSPLYRKEIDSLLITRVSLDMMSSKAKLGQNRRVEQRRRALEMLWKRGQPGDCRAIELILQHSPEEQREQLRPSFLCAPEWNLHCSLDEERARAASALVVDEYWNVGVSLETLVACHHASIAWVGATSRGGRLIGTARAIGDAAKFATILDVAVAADWRSKGVGASLIELLLDHPALRGATRLGLRTRDAMGFYEGFGFSSQRPRGAEYVDMYLRRSA